MGRGERTVSCGRAVGGLLTSEMVLFELLLLFVLLLLIFVEIAEFGVGMGVEVGEKVLLLIELMRVEIPLASLCLFGGGIGLVPEVLL